MMKKIWAMPVVVLAVSVAYSEANAQRPSRSSRVEATPVVNYDTGSNLSGGRNSLGYRLYSGVGFLHGTYGIDEKNAVGFGLGAAEDFDTIGLMADFRHTLVSRGTASLFAEGAIGFVKTNDTKPFSILAGFGFDYGVTDNLHASFAYGLDVSFGTGVTENFSTTQGPFHGNFGLDWKF
jgi:hypothetical protein